MKQCIGFRIYPQLLCNAAEEFQVLCVSSFLSSPVTRRHNIFYTLKEMRSTKKSLACQLRAIRSAACRSTSGLICGEQTPYSHCEYLFQSDILHQNTNTNVALLSKITAYTTLTLISYQIKEQPNKIDQIFNTTTVESPGAGTISQVFVPIFDEMRWESPFPLLFSSLLVPHSSLHVMQNQFLLSNQDIITDCQR